MQSQVKQYDNTTDDHDDFGLPEVNYSPIEREDYTPPAFVPPTYYSNQEEEANKGWLVAAVTGFFVVIGLAIYLV